MLAGELTILDFWVEVLGLGGSLSDLAESLPVENSTNEVQSFLEVIVESIVDHPVEVLKAELTIWSITGCLAGDLVERGHLLFEDAGLVLLESLVLFFFLLELSFKLNDLSVLGLKFMLSLEQAGHGSLRIIRRGLVLLVSFEFFLLLIEQVGLLLGDVRQSLAFEEELLQIGCAVVVVAANLRGLCCVEATFLEGLAVELGCIVDLVQGLHELLIVLVTGETG